MPSLTPFGEACELLRECVEGTVEDCTKWNRKTRAFLKRHEAPRSETEDRDRIAEEGFERMVETQAPLSASVPIDPKANTAAYRVYCEAADKRNYVAWRDVQACIQAYLEASRSSTAPTSDAVRNALIDLVALKDLKEWIEDGVPGVTDTARAEVMARYQREKEPAWEAARKALEAPVSATADTGIVSAAKRWRAATKAWDEATKPDPEDEGHGGSPLEGFEEELRGAEKALEVAVDAADRTIAKP